MKTCLVMQHLVTRLLRQHEVDLDYPEAYLKLEVEGFMPLTIERIGPHEISVAHYYVYNELSGELAPDPDVQIFTGYEQWIPHAISQPALMIAGPDGTIQTPGYSMAAYLAEDRTAITHVKPRAQKDLATFVNQWARNLKAQGFLDRATVTGKKTWPTPCPGPGPATPTLASATSSPDGTTANPTDPMQLALR